MKKVFLMKFFPYSKGNIVSDVAQWEMRDLSYNIIRTEFVFDSILKAFNLLL